MTLIFSFTATKSSLNRDKTEVLSCSMAAEEGPAGPIVESVEPCLGVKDDNDGKRYGSWWEW